MLVIYGGLASASSTQPGTPNEIQLNLLVLPVNDLMWPITPHPETHFVVIDADDDEKDTEKHIKEKFAVVYETDEAHVIVLG